MWWTSYVFMLMCKVVAAMRPLCELDWAIDVVTFRMYIPHGTPPCLFSGKAATSRHLACLITGLRVWLSRDKL